MPKSQQRPSARVRTDEPAPDPAAALIATVARGTARELPSPEAIAALAKLCEYNDHTANGPTKRVGSQAAIDMLQKHYGWMGASVSSLNSLCRQALGRKSWGTP